MSPFAGVVVFDGAPIDRQSEDSLSRAVTALRGGRTVTRRLGDALFAQRISTTDKLSRDSQPCTGRDGRILFAALARLDNREELGATLGLTLSELSHTPDSVLILRVIERWGDAGLARVLGAFAFALWDADAGRLTLGRDCLGNRPLFYYRGRNSVTFATTLGALLALPGVPREIDELALANFMIVNNREQQRTFYRGIERVPSRMLVTIDRAAVRQRAYWAPDLHAPPPYRRDQDYIERARELFDQAVASAIGDTPRVAVSTSGGLDSSAIAATAARLKLADSVTCFTMVPPPGTSIDVGPFRYLGERDKVAALARMHPGLGVRFMAPESSHPFEHDDTSFFARANLPVFGPASYGWYAHLSDAVVEAGHNALLIGNYGNFGLSWRGNFALLALLRAGRLATFTHELRATARQGGQGLARTFASNVLMPAAPSLLRRLIRRLRGHDPDSVAHYSALNPAFIAECDLARKWQDEGFDPWLGPRGRNAARYRAYCLFDRNQLGRDFRGMGQEIQGFEARDPHADRRLLEFLLAVPEPLFCQNGVPRSFARRVLADRLPREILDEHRRGAQAPTWFRNLNARREDISKDIERLDASPIARRMIDVPRLKRLMAQWPKNEQAAEQHLEEYKFALMRAVHVGRFIRWVEGGNV